MKRVMIISTVISGSITALMTVGWFISHLPLIETLAITAGTFFYHFLMRLIVGAAWSPFQSHDPHRRWFQQRTFEASLYKRLRVKRWKDRLPTYDPSLYDTEKHSLYEIAVNMCHSELVHETIIVLSFLPLLEAIPFGTFGVFLLTSTAAAAFDLLFVIIQRYNRPRVLRLAKRYG